jgi:hypothetical protein
MDEDIPRQPFDPTPEELAREHHGINSILDRVDAYRAACLQRGYSPVAAEKMAVAFHEFLWFPQVIKPT